MESKPTAQQVGFFGWLALIFITLRLCHVIDWSWWLVLAPIWGPIAFVIVFIICGLSWYGIKHAHRDDIKRT